MATVTLQCKLCGSTRQLLDEHSRCEDCVNRADRLAGLLTNLDGGVGEALDEFDVSADQLRQWLELCLADVDGALSGTQIARRSVDTSERGVWEVSPSSAFEDRDEDGLEPEPNRIRHLRGASRVSLESLGDRIGATVGELALWERGEGQMPHEHAQQLAGFFGVSIGHLMGWDESPLITRRRIERGEKGPNGHNGEGHAA